MSKKIIKVEENVDFSVFTKFTKDLGLFQVTARVWTIVSTQSPDVAFNHEISDTELDFSMNNKPCKYMGFKELYEKLYGVNTFNQFCADLYTEFEAAYFKHTPYKTK